MTHEIRATYDAGSIRVYQAFDDEIAGNAVRAGRFVEPFRLNRMSWIKPSFNWMMYRSGFAGKAGQTSILAVDMAREGFDWLIRHAVASQFDASVPASPEAWKEAFLASSVRVQWDPERDWKLQVVPDLRTIQLGLSGSALGRYVDAWTIRITDVTALARANQQAVLDDVAPTLGYPPLRERPCPVRSRP